MNKEYYQYMKELHTFINYQANKLQKLESTVKELKQGIDQLKEKPPFQVGRIEYKFDQLKVETLEGTLNIGLNPSDLEGISDFTVDKQNIHVPPSPKTLFQESIDIENNLREFLDTELPAIYHSATEHLSMEVDDSYYQLIKDDIHKQLPNRIQTHFTSLAAEERENLEDAKQGIIEKVKTEIHQGVYLFLEQLQKQTKGEKN